MCVCVCWGGAGRGGARGGGGCSAKNYIDGDTTSDTVIDLFCTQPITLQTLQSQGRLSILEAHLIWTEEPNIPTHVIINLEILNY